MSLYPFPLNPMPRFRPGLTGGQRVSIRCDTRVESDQQANAVARTVELAISCSVTYNAKAPRLT